MAGCVQPNTHVLLRLQSDIQKVVEVVPNSTITLPKVGIVPTNLLLGRPFFYTYELVERPHAAEDSDHTIETAHTSQVSQQQRQRNDRPKRHKNTNRQPNRAVCVSLRIVSPAELRQEALTTPGKDEPTNGTCGGDADNDSDGIATPASSSTFQLPNTSAEAHRSNRLTIDDSSRQQLSMQQIEALKLSGTGSGKDIVEKIKQSHLGLDEKTEFSLAKYTLRKERKYLRRFTLLPLDTALLAEYLMEKEAGKIMELRRESLALITSWANVRWSEDRDVESGRGGEEEGEGEGELAVGTGTGTGSQGRWLVVDDTGGLIIAALAEKMGILHHPDVNIDSDSDSDSDSNPETDDNANTDSKPPPMATLSQSKSTQSTSQIRPSQKPKGPDTMSSQSNTLTMIHPNPQPNLGLLQYFGYNPNAPSCTHPLYTRLHTLSWLQLLHPTADAGYIEPTVLSQSEIGGMKSNKRSTYFRKRKRWARVKSVVDIARAGNFDGLVIATTMDLDQTLRATIPLLKGGARVVIFSPSIEPLTGVVDMFSKERKTAWLRKFDELTSSPEPTPPTSASVREDETMMTDVDPDIDTNPQLTKLETSKKMLEDEFGLDPTTLLAPSIQTARARTWQVLPGRTHPLMTSRGGSEGYILTSTRVFAHEGKVEAKGVHMKKRRID